MKNADPVAFAFAIGVGLVVFVGMMTGVAAGKGGDPADRSLKTSPKTFWTYQGIYTAVAIGFLLYSIFRQ